MDDFDVAVSHASASLEPLFDPFPLKSSRSRANDNEFQYEMCQAEKRHYNYKYRSFVRSMPWHSNKTTSTLLNCFAVKIIEYVKGVDVFFLSIMRDLCLLY
jgi:hypothetical protein